MMRAFRLLLGGLLGGGLIWTLLFSLRGAQAVVVNAAAQVEPELQRHAVMDGARWLVETHQNEDGGYTAFSQGAGEGPSDVAGTVDAVLALASAGYQVDAPYPGREQTPIGYLEGNAEAVGAYAQQNGAANGKLILALTAAGEDPRSFAGYDLTISLTQHLSPTGQYGVVSPFEQSLAILAQSVVSEAVPSEAVAWLLAAQASEGDLAGSWDDGFGTAGNIDATAMAIMALAEVDAAAHEAALATGRTFLSENQLEDGGWGYAPGLPSSANSTALALQALSALGEDFYSADSQWAVGDVTPLQALLNWRAENGAFQADFGDGPADDFFTTVQALPALSGRPLPLPARHEAVRQALACLGAMRDLESGGWPEFAGSGPSAGGTARAMRAIEAAGGDVTAPFGEDVTTTPLEALRALTPAYLEAGRGGRVGVVMRSAVSGGADVEDFGGIDLALRLSDYLSPTGEYDDTAFGPYSHAQAMLGLLSAGIDPDPSAVAWLLAAQGEDGSWGSPDTTGISLQALVQLGGEPYEEPIAGGVASLRATQQADGGWGFAFPSSVNSTAEVAQGLALAGENPFDPTWSVVTSGTLRNGADFTLAQQGANGCWPNLFGEGDDPYATTDGIILLAQQAGFGVLEPEAGEAEGEAEEQAEPTPEPAAVATPTEEVIVEATEVVPSPTAEAPELDEELVPEAEDGAEDAPATAVAAGSGEPEDAAQGDGVQGNGAQGDEFDWSLLLWIAVGFALLLLVMAYFRRKDDET